MPKMKPEIKAKWLAALRGGKYKQTAGVLRDERGMCCLGVLIDVVDPKGWKQDRDNCIFSYDGEDQLPTAAFCKRVGLPAPVPKYVSKYGTCTTITDKLAEMNDDDGKSFTEIADFIEDVL